MTRLLFGIVLLLVASPIWAGPVTLETWYCGSWGSGTPAAVDGCGGFTADAGSLIEDPGSSPFTITLLAPAYLVIVDAYYQGDVFEAFDFGSSLGTTSPSTPVEFTSCAGGNDPVTCLADPNYSFGYFLLGAGSHEITISTVVNDFDGGAAFFRISEQGPDGAVPEPGTYALMGAGLAGLAMLRRRR